MPTTGNIQVAGRTSLKSGVGILQINKKVQPRTGYQINQVKSTSIEPMF
jgi:hypothetical protein